MIIILTLAAIGIGVLLGWSAGAFEDAPEPQATKTTFIPMAPIATEPAPTTTPANPGSTTIAPPSSTTTVPAPVGSDAVQTEWDLVFADEFEGDSLGEAWVTCYWWAQDSGCTNGSNGNLQWYLPDGVSVEDGTLRLIARAEDVAAPDGADYEDVSGIVTTGSDRDDGPIGFSFEYGYVEARMRVPSGTGLWPALWMLPITHESRPEIDIMEVLGHAPNTVEMHMHVLDSSGERVSVGSEWTGPDLSAGWHTYAVDWSPDRVIWYVDGEERWRTSDPELVPAEPLYLIANLAVGGEWPGSPNPDTEFPAVFEIDYVRVWQERTTR